MSFNHNNSIKLALLAYITGKSKLDIAIGNYTLTTQQAQNLQIYLNQITQEHKPLSHITNQQTFYGRTFYINQHVLDPRPETEEIITIAKHLHQSRKINSILDLGTGSGCLLTTLALELNLTNNQTNIHTNHLYAVDISLQALEVAKINLSHYQIPYTTILSNWFQNVPIQLFDLIVCNPPYIGIDDEIDQTALHDPKIALYAKQDGFEHYSTILPILHQYLRYSAIFEIPTKFIQLFSTLATQYNFTTTIHRLTVDNIVMIEINPIKLIID